jgi:hypothetical protein
VICGRSSASSLCTSTVWNALSAAASPILDTLDNLSLCGIAFMLQ